MFRNVKHKDKLILLSLKLLMGSIGRGTFGGGREALMQSEQDRATQQLLSDIQADRWITAAYEKH
jgi:hypothetical protein